MSQLDPDLFGDGSSKQFTYPTPQSLSYLGLECPAPNRTLQKNPNSGFKLQLKGSVLQKAASDSFGQNPCLRLPLQHIYWSICVPNSHLWASSIEWECPWALGLVHLWGDTAIQQSSSRRGPSPTTNQLHADGNSSFTALGGLNQMVTWKGLKEPGKKQAPPKYINSSPWTLVYK